MNCLLAVFKSTSKFALSFILIIYSLSLLSFIDFIVFIYFEYLAVCKSRFNFFSRYATGRTTGVVFGSGHSVMQVFPIYEGFTLPHLIMRVKLACRDVTKQYNSNVYF